MPSWATSNIRRDAINVADNTALIQEAQTALHALMTGSRVVEITSANGSKVSFSDTNTAQLEAYITKLQASDTTAQKPRRPIQIRYGR
jgi:cytochrome c553